MKLTLKNGSLDVASAQSKNHTFDADLHLQVFDIFRTKNYSLELITREADIHHKLMQQVLDGIVPRMVQATGEDSRLPDVKTTHEAKTSINTQWKMGTRKQDGSPAIDAKLQMKVSVSTDRSLNPAQALYASRGGVASMIADNIVANLKRHFLGVTKSKAESSTRLENNGIMEHSQSSTPEAGNN